MQDALQATDRELVDRDRGPGGIVGHRLGARSDVVSRGVLQRGSRHRQDVADREGRAEGDAGSRGRSSRAEDLSEVRLIDIASTGRAGGGVAVGGQGGVVELVVALQTGTGAVSVGGAVLIALSAKHSAAEGDRHNRVALIGRNGARVGRRGGRSVRSGHLSGRQVSGHADGPNRRDGRTLGRQRCTRGGVQRARTVREEGHGRRGPGQSSGRKAVLVRGAVHEDDGGGSLAVTVQRFGLGAELHQLLGGVVPVVATHTGDLDGGRTSRAVLDGLHRGLDVSRNRSGATKDDDVLDAVHCTVQDRRSAGRQAVSRLHEEDRRHVLPSQTRDGNGVREVACRGQEHRGVRVPVGAEVLQRPDLGSHRVGRSHTIGTGHAGHDVAEVGDRRGHAGAHRGGTADDVHGVTCRGSRVDLTNGQRGRPLQGVWIGEDHRTTDGAGESSSGQAVRVAVAAHQDGGGRRTAVRRDGSRGRRGVYVHARDPGALGNGLRCGSRAGGKCETSTGHENGQKAGYEASGDPLAFILQGFLPDRCVDGQSLACENR